MQFPEIGKLLLSITSEALPVSLFEICECMTGEVRDVSGENAPETDDDWEVIRIKGFNGGPV